MKKLILVRGICGSGKTTLSGYLQDNLRGLRCIPHHVEADMYFVRPDGRYDFTPSSLRYAHKWCQDYTKACLTSFVPDYNEFVVVSNTFTQLWEMQPYINMCEDNKDILVVTCTGNWGSVHNVPEDTLNKMKERWEETVDYIDSVVYDGSNADEVIKKIKGD